MTNGWIDIKNTDMMLIMGGNPAENHPCGFKWAIEAKTKRNAKMLVVDPRFTRTAATADMFLQIRAGADIAFLGGLINYAIENNRIAKDYLVNYTNAAFIVKEGFKLPEDGLFSGFDAAGATYDKASWNYEEGGNVGPEAAGGAQGGATTPPSGADSAAGGPKSSANTSQEQQRQGTEPARSFERGGARGAEAPAVPAAERRLRPLAPARALRLPTLQEAVLALHAGDGRAHHGHQARGLPQGRGPLHLRPQGRRHEEGRHDHLRRRVDAAHLRHTDA